MPHYLRLKYLDVKLLRIEGAGLTALSAKLEYLQNQVSIL